MDEKVKGKRCPYCGKEEVYIGASSGEILDENMKVLIEFETRACDCNNCGSPIYSAEVDEFNRFAEAEAMRAIHPELLTLKEIRGLPQKYGITRADFKVVMGIPSTFEYDGDIVPFKIFEGDEPDSDLEERLRAIFEDPKVYVEFLKLAKGKISDEAYEKSMAKALERVG